jgi:hypothetical protein
MPWSDLEQPPTYECGGGNTTHVKALTQISPAKFAGVRIDLRRVTNMLTCSYTPACSMGSAARGSGASKCGLPASSVYRMRADGNPG